MITHCFLLPTLPASRIVKIVDAKRTQPSTLTGVSTIGRKADFQIGQMADACLILLADGKEEESVGRRDDYRTILTPGAPDHA